MKKLSKCKWGNVSAKLHHYTCDLIPKIGIEIHVRPELKSKLFSKSLSTQYSNINNISMHDLAVPGTLPILNRKILKLAVNCSEMLKCQIQKKSLFERKHYFYSDLPAGYQITQKHFPIAKQGVYNYIHWGNNGQPIIKKVGIIQLQIEQDTGQIIIDDKKNKHLVNFDRCGEALFEIVTAPDFYKISHVTDFIKSIRIDLWNHCISKLNISDGQFRADLSVSLHKPHQLDLTDYRIEIKNLSLTKEIQQALEYEIDRQKTILNKGEKLYTESRMFDSNTMKTIKPRNKLDYRFIPEHNIGWIDLDAMNLSYEKNDIKKKIQYKINEIISDLFYKHGLCKDEIYSCLKEPTFLTIYLSTIESFTRNNQTPNFRTVYKYISSLFYKEYVNTNCNDSKLWNMSLVIVLGKMWLKKS
ncbi:hypothetical protein A3Q56_06388 [Intoshia linei]|uniref:Aspartyl/Glutamyl-tRNA(Gln) amidotransferase subunit B/E catalytic domain-containing protein n=1 Tax=Intoshia linei TaxID=1819745 RepID=A0A177AWM0_9BILA|nr:hypothetical protein A3Q56_06388 [Intoshia linei]